MDNAGDKLFGIPVKKDEIWIYDTNFGTWARKKHQVDGGSTSYRRVRQFEDTLVIIYYHNASIGAYSMSKEKVLFKAKRSPTSVAN